jgi:hypothetical protein
VYGKWEVAKRHPNVDCHKGVGESSVCRERWPSSCCQEQRASSLELVLILLITFPAVWRC